LAQASAWPRNDFFYTRGVVFRTCIPKPWGFIRGHTTSTGASEHISTSMGCASSAACPPHGFFGEEDWPVCSQVVWTRTSGRSPNIPNICADVNGIQSATASFTSTFTSQMITELHFTDGFYTATVSSEYAGSLPGAITLERLDAGGQLFSASTFMWDTWTRVLKLSHGGYVVLTAVDYSTKSIITTWGEHCIYVFPGDVPRPRDENPRAKYPANPCWAVCTMHRDWTRSSVTRDVAKGTIYLNASTIADETRLYAAIVFSIVSAGRWHVVVKEL